MPAPLVLCQIARLLGASAAATLADAIMAYCMRALTPVHRQVATSPRPSAAAPLTLLQASIHSSSPPSHFRLARGTYRASGSLPSPRLTPRRVPSSPVTLAPRVMVALLHHLPPVVFAARCGLGPFPLLAAARGGPAGIAPCLGSVLGWGATEAPVAEPTVATRPAALQEASL